MLAGPPQVVAPDSLRRALGEVFARPEYRWIQGRSLWHWLLGLWYRLLDWLGTLQTAHPEGYATMIWFFSLLSLAALTSVLLLWRRESGPHGHGLEVARVSPAPRAGSA